MNGNNFSLLIIMTLPVELMKLYYESDKPKKRVRVNCPSYDELRYIHSIRYIIQFMNNGKIIEELSLILTNHEKSIYYTFMKHMYNSKFHKLCDDFSTRKKTYIDFVQSNKNLYLITLSDDGQVNDCILILTLSNYALIDKFIKVIVYGNDSHPNHLVLYNPSDFELKYYYRVQLTKDKINNKIIVYDCGIDSIDFNEDSNFKLICTPNKCNIMCLGIRLCNAVLLYSFKRVY